MNPRDVLSVVIPMYRRFACEASRAGSGLKASRLKDMCAAPASRRCVSRTRIAVQFFACGRHTPREGFDVLPLGATS